MPNENAHQISLPSDVPTGNPGSTVPTSTLPSDVPTGNPGSTVPTSTLPRDIPTGGEFKQTTLKFHRIFER